jgi:flagellar hook-associated protein 3 FlgL
MRVTSNSIVNTFLQNLSRNVARLEKYQSQLSSGIRVRWPSEDPVTAARVMDLQSAVDISAQYRENAEGALSLLNTVDRLLGSAGDLLQRARELAVQGGSETLSTSDMQAAAREVEQLLEQMVQVGNSQYGDAYVFGGFKTNSPPFSAVGSPPSSIIYNGDAGIVFREVNPGALVAVNLPGNTVFSPAFTALIGLRDALQMGSTAGVQASIGSLDVAIDAVLAARAEVGSRVNRLEDAVARLSDLDVNLRDLLSRRRDIDVAEAITAFSREEAAYQAALAAGAKSIQPSLLDFLK